MPPRDPGSGAAFALSELLIVIAIMALLGTLLVPALLDALAFADQVTCTSNLRQLGLATKYYLDEHDGFFFPIRFAGAPRQWYFGYEEDASGEKPEGERGLDKTRGILYRYMQNYHGIELCPSFARHGPSKPKFTDAWWTYGVNKVLCPDHARPEDLRNVSEIQGEAGRIVLFADAAYVNWWQAPASPTNPLVEEWHYVLPRDYPLPDSPHVHFRHGGLANVLFADWHVEAVGPAEGSLDPRLPQARIGYFDDRDVLFEPRAGR